MLVVSLYVALLCALARGERVSKVLKESNPAKEWTGWRRCPDYTYAAGINIKGSSLGLRAAPGCESDTSEDVVKASEHAGLNGVALLCLPFDWQSHENAIEIRSGEGPAGVWQRPKWCPRGQFVIGYQIHAKQTKDGYDNFAAMCEEPVYREYMDERNLLMGVSSGLGSWSFMSKCSSRDGVCGVNTVIEEGISDINVECCKVELACTPDVDFVRICSLDNYGTVVTVTCAHRAFVKSLTRPDHVPSLREKALVIEKISVALGDSGSDLHKKIINRGWSPKPSELTFSVEQAKYDASKPSMKIELPKWASGSYEQMQFTCGEYQLGILKYRSNYDN